MVKSDKTTLNTKLTCCIVSGKKKSAIESLIGKTAAAASTPKKRPTLSN